jgi:hypothetical protein
MVIPGSGAVDTNEVSKNVISVYFVGGRYHFDSNRTGPIGEGL